MDEQIQSVSDALNRLIEQRGIRHVFRGAQAIIKYIWWMFGQISPFFLMMALCVGAGMVNYQLAINPAGFGGIQAVAGDSAVNQQFVSVMMVLFGAMIGYTKRNELLTLGVLFWLYYGIVIGWNTANGAIIPQGFLAFIYTIIGVLGIARASYELQLREKVAKELAAIKALRANNGRANHRDIIQ